LQLQTMTSNHKPLPLSSTLRDLALLRASDIDLTSLLPPKPTPSSEPDFVAKVDVDDSVRRSYEFAREARAAVKILNNGEVDREGARLETGVRNQLEDVLKGLGG
jgi:hypothetical protein